MNCFKKICLVIALMMTGGIYTLAQTSGMKIVTGYPDLKIKVTRCEAFGKTVFIDMTFENIGSNDVMYSIYAGGWNNTVAYDDEGNKFEVLMQEGKSGFRGLLERHWLPAEIPIKIRARIEGVSESATMFKRFDIGMDCEAWGLVTNKPIKITNIPISREGDD